jgi:hypothetical protein
MKDPETFWRECELKHPGNFSLVINRKYQTHFENGLLDFSHSLSDI